MTAVALGLGLSIVMGSANVYLGLSYGMTVSASIPAAVVGMGLLRVLRTRPALLESNLVQTAASAGESLAAGIIFTMPALVLAGIWDSFAGWDRYWIISAVGLTGGLLGVLLMIPMRRSFITENRELLYPEGVACAEVLRTGETGGGGALLVLAGILAGSVFKFGTMFLSLAPKTLEYAKAQGERVYFFGVDVSPALIGVGYIVGLRIAVLISLGGATAWLVALPLHGGFGSATPGQELISEIDYAWSTWGSQLRYMGVGAMVVGGFVSIFRVRKGLKAAFSEVTGRRGTTGGPALSLREQNLTRKVLLPTTVVTIFIIAVLYFALTQDAVITAITLVAMLILSFFFAAVACYIVGLVGNSNSPVSGMTITALLATALLVAAFQYRGEIAIVATLGVAGVVCCVACTAGDVCNDLKTGQLVGASPRHQQLLQILGVFVAAFIMWPILYLLHDGNIAAGGDGIGGKDLLAPQANLFASLTQAFFNSGMEESQKRMLLLGVGIGIVIVVLDGVLGWLRPQSQFRLHLMPIAVGMYLPMSVSIPILLGGVVAAATARNSHEGGSGVLLASGIIAGEALMGVLIAGLFVAGLRGVEGWVPESVGVVVACAILAVICAWLFQAARQRSAAPKDTA